MVTLDALAFGAHADDVELACSGTIIKLGVLGYKTGIITLTQGEMATRGSAEIRAIWIGNWWLVRVFNSPESMPAMSTTLAPVIGQRTAFGVIGAGPIKGNG